MKPLTQWPEADIHFLVLAFAWLSFSIILGLVHAFNALESAPISVSRAIVGGSFTTCLLVMAGGLFVGVPLRMYMKKSKQKR